MPVCHDVYNHFADVEAPSPAGNLVSSVTSPSKSLYYIQSMHVLERVVHKYTKKYDRYVLSE